MKDAVRQLPREALHLTKRLDHPSQMVKRVERRGAAQLGDESLPVIG